MHSPRPASNDDQNDDQNTARESTPSPSIPSVVFPAEQIIGSADLTGPAVALPQPPLVALRQSVAFALSALLSPYLVIPVGTIATVASVAYSRREWLIWTMLSVFFSTGIPALYVLIQVWRGKITDLHVMEREQRSGPFLVAIFSSAVGALLLRSLGANVAIWGIGVVLTINGIANGLRNTG